MVTYPKMDNAALFRVRTEAAKRVRLAMDKHKLHKDSVRGIVTTMP